MPLFPGSSEQKSAPVPTMRHPASSPASAPLRPRFSQALGRAAVDRNPNKSAFQMTGGPSSARFADPRRIVLTRSQLHMSQSLKRHVREIVRINSAQRRLPATAVHGARHLLCLDTSPTSRPKRSSRQQRPRSDRYFERTKALAVAARQDQLRLKATFRAAPSTTQFN